MMSNAPQEYAIEVEVHTQYLPEQSTDDESRFVYTYTISIHNRGQRSAQLISRHWKITDEHQKVHEVKGLGVIGEQPTIEPNSSYTYTSGAVLETETGSMQGSYQMLGDNGEHFDVPIALFSLIPPRVVH